MRSLLIALLASPVIGMTPNAEAIPRFPHLKDQSNVEECLKTEHGGCCKRSAGGACCYRTIPGGGYFYNC